MDLSALIFVALAVAWAVYLVPKALKHHEEDAAGRTVDRFSDRMRVVARREAVSATEAALVPAGRRADVVEPSGVTVEAELAAATAAPADHPASRSASDPAAFRRRPQHAAAARAAARRRRVLGALLLAVVALVALSSAGVVSPWWIALPTVLTVGWLVLCRVMVQRERAARRAITRKRRRTLADEALEDEAGHGADDTDEIPAVTAPLAEEADPAPVDPDAWTPVPVPLPTYVDKAPAGRSVRTIDLDSTGVWSSGRNEADSQLAREADAQRAVRAEGSDAEQRRAAGS